MGTWWGELTQAKGPSKTGSRAIYLSGSLSAVSKGRASTQAHEFFSTRPGKGGKVTVEYPREQESHRERDAVDRALDWK